MSSLPKSSFDIDFGKLRKAPPPPVGGQPPLPLLGVEVEEREGVLDPPEYDPLDSRSSLVVFEWDRGWC